MVKVKVQLSICTPHRHMGKLRYSSTSQLIWVFSNTAVWTSIQDILFLTEFWTCLKIQKGADEVEVVVIVVVVGHTIFFSNTARSLVSELLHVCWYSNSLQGGRSGDQIPVGTMFSACDQTGPGPNPASYTMGTGSCPGVKWLGHSVDHPPPSIADVEERVELFLYFPSGLWWPDLGWTLPFTYFGHVV
jgi:hypothetical protein